MNAYFNIEKLEEEIKNDDADSSEKTMPTVQDWLNMNNRTKHTENAVSNLNSGLGLSLLIHNAYQLISQQDDQLLKQKKTNQ